MGHAYHKTLHGPMTEKHPIKRLDNFKIGDWVTETYQWLACRTGKIVAFGVSNDNGWRFARIRSTDGDINFVSLDTLRHVEPALVVLLEEVNTDAEAK